MFSFTIKNLSENTHKMHYLKDLIVLIVFVGSRFPSSSPNNTGS